MKEINGLKSFVTKGDHNNSPDSNEVKFENIRGKYSGKIDGIGKFILDVKTSFGAIVFYNSDFRYLFLDGKKRR